MENELKSIADDILKMKIMVETDHFLDSLVLDFMRDPSIDAIPNFFNDISEDIPLVVTIPRAKRIRRWMMLPASVSADTYFEQDIQTFQGKTSRRINELHPFAPFVVIDDVDMRLMGVGILPDDVKLELKDLGIEILPFILSQEPFTLRVTDLMTWKDDDFTNKVKLILGLDESGQNKRKFD